ncbi:hypothetical protein KX816_18895 [Sphingosinicellaceae bacterium]|nr:hypothetical protein KX816_18895 [Sphingosinicellaceae bacterium]
MFGTGIENSIPTVKGGIVRVDEMAKCDHYRRGREGFALLDEIGVGYLRYGPPMRTTFRGSGRYEWEFADVTFGHLVRTNIVPIVDLCHFPPGTVRH